MRPLVERGSDGFRSNVRVLRPKSHPTDLAAEVGGYARGVPLEPRNTLSADDVDRAVGLQRISRRIMRALTEHSGPGVDAAIDDALAAVGEFCGVDRSYTFQFRAEMTRVDNTHEWCAPGIVPAIDTLQDVDAEVAATWIEAFERDEHVFIRSVDRIPDDEADLREILAEQDIQSLLVAPLRAGGELFGFMGFDYVRRETELSWVDLDVLRTIADNIAAAMARRRVEEQLRERGASDALTDLPNRVAFAQALDRALERSRPVGSRRVAHSAPPNGVAERRTDVVRSGIVVGLIDIDAFAEVNTALGFAAGDALVRAVADRLRSVMRPADVLARIGGDDFAVLIEGARDEDSGPMLAARLRASLADTYRVLGRAINVTGSVGVVVDDGTFDSSSSLLAAVEAALREAKHDGGNRSMVFDADIAVRHERRQRLTAALRESDAAEHVSVVYQPVVELETDRIVGAESLARWSAPSTGPVAPDVFIGVAEEIGVIGGLTDHILRTALTELTQRFQPASSRGFSLSVNLSAAHVAETGFLREFDEIVAASGMDRTKLWVELTESVVTAGPVVLEHLEAIRASGIGVAVDDFGTGYSSFARLRNLPFNGIKIDRAFVAGIHHDPVAQALVAAQVEIAASLGLSLLAEGVETPEERATLRAIGVRYGQGFGLHCPMAAADLAELLSRG